MNANPLSRPPVATHFTSVTRSRPLEVVIARPSGRDPEAFARQALPLLDGLGEVSGRVSPRGLVVEAVWDGPVLAVLRLIERATGTPAHVAERRVYVEEGPPPLEPYIDLSVRVPEEALGDVIGELNRRRGRIESMERADGDDQAVGCLTPLRELGGFPETLGRLTRGRGSAVGKVGDYFETDGGGSPSDPPVEIPPP